MILANEFLCLLDKKPLGKAFSNDDRIFPKDQSEKSENQFRLASCQRFKKEFQLSALK